LICKRANITVVLAKNMAYSLIHDTSNSCVSRVIVAPRDNAKKKNNPGFISSRIMKKIDKINQN